MAQSSSPTPNSRMLQLLSSSGGFFLLRVVVRLVPAADFPVPERAVVVLRFVCAIVPVTPSKQSAKGGIRPTPAQTGPEKCT